MRRAVAGLLLGVVIVLFVASHVSYASIPHLITVEGKLTDGTTNAPLVGPYNISLGIWTASSGGSRLYTEDLIATTDSFGIFQVMLGSTQTLALPFDQQYYLEITVNGTTVSPRQPLTSTPSSYRTNVTENIDCTGCVRAPSIADNAVTLNKTNCTLYYVAGEAVGINVDFGPQCNDANGCYIRLSASGFALGNPTQADWAYYYRWGTYPNMYWRAVGYNTTGAFSRYGNKSNGVSELVIQELTFCTLYDSTFTNDNTFLLFEAIVGGCYAWLCD